MAQDLRARLTAEQIDDAIAACSRTERVIVGKLDKLYYGKPIRQHVREFCDLFALIGVGLALWHLLKHSPVLTSGVWLGLSLVIWSLGKTAPGLVHPVWKAWMFLAEKLGGVSTYLILSIAWTFLLLPTACFIKLARIKVLNLDYRHGALSYWEVRDPKRESFKLLERQF